MEETIICPGCQAQLSLPSMPAGQTVQCPRCQRVFEPRPRPQAPVATGSPQRRSAEPTAMDDLDTFATPRRIVPVESLIGPWFGYFTMAVIAALVVAFLVRAYVEYEDLDADPLGHVNLINHFLLLREVEFWQTAASWVALPTFAIWVFLASRNARLLHASGFSLSPGWGLAIFCCPILNVIFVYLNLQEIWRASDPRQIETSESWRNASPGALIRLWGLNVLCAILQLFFWANDHRGGLFGKWTFCVLNLNVAFAGALLIAIIYLIRTRQQERYIRLYEDPD